MEQFTQLPAGEKNVLTPIEKLIYLYLRKYMNEETKMSFPSQERLARESGLSRPTIAKAINGLIDLNYIEKLPVNGKVTHYRFKKLLKFEPFSYKFLDNKDIKPLDKAYIVAAQEFMFKDEEGKGKITYSNRKLGELINMPCQTISKCNQSLAKQKALSLSTNNDGEMVKTFNLDDLGQAIIWKLKEHEELLDDHEDRLAKLEEANKKQQELIDKLLKEKEDKELYL